MKRDTTRHRDTVVVPTPKPIAPKPFMTAVQRHSLPTAGPSNN
ncbi:hypothetical protein [Spirosoma sp. KNUC1025]